jgi:hypothetical protein
MLIHYWFSVKEWNDKSFVILGRSRFRGEQVGLQILFYEVTDNHLTARFSNIKKWNFGVLNCEKFDAYKLKCKCPDHLIRKLRRVYEGEFDEWINGALWFRRFKTKIPLRTHTMVTWQQYAHHIWTHVQINKPHFRHSGYNNLTLTNFLSLQENQDLPSLHPKSSRAESTPTPVNREDLSGTAQENPQILRCGCWKIYITQQKNGISFQMTKMYQIILDFIFLFCR